MEWFNGVMFYNKWAFWLFIVPVFMLGWFIWRFNKQFVSLTYSSTKNFGNYFSYRGLFKQLLPLLRILSIVFLIIAIARPQSTSREEKRKTEGISIVLAIDISTSMLVNDFKPNRISAAKEVASNFIQQRPNDRIGLVIFGGESYTQCPITIDHEVLQEQLTKIEPGMLIDGTAIGMGLGTAVNRLQNNDTKSKVIILLTDGVNNAGFVDPLTESESAKKMNVRVYTIGVGKQGGTYKIRDPNTGQEGTIVGEIDEKLLGQIAINTGGKYFKASNNSALKNVFNEIDKMEKTKVEVSAFERKAELFLPYALIAFSIFFIEILLRYTLFRSIP